MKRTFAFYHNEPLEYNHIVSRSPKLLYPQETDWTCMVACVRTLLSGIEDQVPQEVEIVNRYKLMPGPYYSKDVKKLGILNEYDAVYGCDIEDKNFDMILNLMENGYYVMLECMYNYAHWFVLLGYYPTQDYDIENSRLLVYDPYYNQVRLLNTDEFLYMWRDGSYMKNGIEKDFIAVKK